MKKKFVKITGVILALGISVFALVSCGVQDEGIESTSGQVELLE